MRQLNRPVLVKPPGKDSIPADIFKVMGPGPRKLPHPPQQYMGRRHDTGI